VFFQPGSTAGSPFFFFAIPAKIHDPCSEHMLTGPADGVFQGSEKLGKVSIFEESASFLVKTIVRPGALCFNRCVQRRLARDHQLFLAFPPFPLAFVLRGGRLLFFSEFLQPFRQRFQLFVHKVIDGPLRIIAVCP